MIQKSGSNKFTFIHREDLYTLPDEVLAYETDLHTMFTRDTREGYRHIYYSLAQVGIIKISPDMQKQDIISIPNHLKIINFHSCKFAEIKGNPRLILTANDNEMIAIFDLDGNLDFTVQRPIFTEYQNPNYHQQTPCSSSSCNNKCSKSKQGRTKYHPTDTVLHDNKLYIADGYAENYISVYDIKHQEWDFIFGGKTDNAHTNGKFRTAHSITLTPNQQQLIIADRWNSRLQVHDFDGSYVESHYLPDNAWLCNIDFVEWEGQALGVIACLYDTDEEKNRPAPIYIVDGKNFEILSIIYPKEDLGIDLAQRIHNAIWHIHDNHLFLICHSWNPGKFFVLQHT